MKNPVWEALVQSQVKFNGFRRRLRKRRFWESLVQGRVSSNRFSRGFPALGFAVRFGKIIKITSRLATVGDAAEIYYFLKYHSFN